MKRFTFILVFLFTIICVNNAFAHKRAKFNIVIDTDGGVDDFRALTYFMASRDFNINAITTVDGVLSADMSSQYVRQLCNLFHHEGIPVGEGDVKSKKTKSYVKHLIIWGNIFEIKSDCQFEKSSELIEKAIRTENKRTIIIALGPLSNIAVLVKNHPELIPKIETVIWYSDFDKNPIGYNYEFDKKSFNTLMEKQIPVKMITSDETKYMNSFVKTCSEVKSIYAQTFYNALKHTGNEDVSMSYSCDLIPFYLIYPSMFIEEVVLDYARLIKPNNQNLFDILGTGILNFDKPEQGVIYNELPTEGFYLRNDIGNFADTIIASHGYTEFKLVSITSEIHSHLGVYSVLGAKVGLRIMEYLHAGLDEIEIVSYAGYTPPTSCFNDGLQVGTGSTIGYGTITVDTTQNLRPEVLVKYNGREILFSVKPEIVNQIRTEISRLVKSDGIDSEMYWIKLRDITIKKYWLGMSRFDILDIEELE